MKIEQGKPPPVGIRFALPREQTEAEGDPGMAGKCAAAEQGPKMKFLFQRRFFPAQQAEQHGMTRVARGALVVSVNGKKRRIKPPDRFVGRKENLEGTEELKLPLTGAVIPGTE